jgi:Ap4A phosphorylase N-terminal domain
MHMVSSADASPQATLWSRIKEVYQTATTTGAAQGIKATRNVIEDSDLGVCFVVYVAESLNKKPTAPLRTKCAF